MPPGTVYPDVLAAIYYEDADTSADPMSSSPEDDISCENDDLTVTRPEFPIKPSSEPAVLDLVLTLALNETGNFEWQTNGQAYRADYNEPLLYKVKDGQTSFPDDPQYNVYNMGNSSSVVLNVTNLTPFAHPFHLHGHTFFVLNVGQAGTVWDESVIEPENPMRRDTQIIPSGGYAALQFEGDNPGGELPVRPSRFARIADCDCSLAFPLSCSMASLGRIICHHHQSAGRDRGDTRGDESIDM